VLNHVRVIQGDGVNRDSIRAILNHALEGGYSASNIAFGMGGALLQQLNRDTQKFAMKCSAVKLDGAWRDVFKDPVTDPGKKSKAGRLALVETPGGYATVPRPDGQAPSGDVLAPVFENGKLLVEYTMEQVRARAARETERLAH